MSVEVKNPICKVTNLESTSNMISCPSYSEVCVTCDNCHKHPKDVSPVGEGALFCSECEKNMITQNYDE
jgi:hypothetical protein